MMIMISLTDYLFGSHQLVDQEPIDDQHPAQFFHVLPVLLAGPVGEFLLSISFPVAFGEF